MVNTVKDDGITDTIVSQGIVQSLNIYKKDVKKYTLLLYYSNIIIILLVTLRGKEFLVVLIMIISLFLYINKNYGN